ncbi:MAG: MFS transporter [Firmicutes bacterium]|nr:MFS transporter [Bacillota bacterium]
MHLLVIAIVESVRGALVFSLLPQYGSLLEGYSISLIGTLVFLLYLLDNCFRIPAGWWADRQGGRVLLLNGIAISTLGVIIIFTNGTKAGLLLGTSLFGMGAAPVWPVVVSQVVRKSLKSRLGESLSWVFIAWLAGSGVGIVGINFLLSQSYSAAFWFLLGILAAAFLIAATMSHKKIDQPDKQGLSGYIADLGKEMASLWFLYPGMLIQTMSLGLLMPIVALYIRGKFGMSAEQFSLILTGAGGVTVLMLVPTGKIADYLGEKWMLTLGLLLSSACLIGLPFINLLYPTLFIGALLGVSYSIILPAWNRFQARVAPPEKLGSMWAVFMAIEGIGIGIGSLVGGMVGERYGYSAPFFLSGCMLLVMAMFYILMKIENLSGNTVERIKDERDQVQVKGWANQSRRESIRG